MNLGIEKSIGEYLYFIGSGDELFRFDSLLCVSNILQNKDVDILMCNVITNNILYPGLDFNLEKIYHGAMCCHQGIFMKRNWFINLNGFDVKYLIASDFDLILRAIKNGASTIFVNLCVARYLGGGISDKNSSISNKTIILMKSGFFFNSFKFLFIELLAKYYRKYLKMNFNLLV
jgi:hypothetical protein